MNLTRAQALEYHRQMWRDMQEDLGDCPDWDERTFYKQKWCKTRFPQEKISSDCFLCAYALQEKVYCKGCPIDWGENMVCQRPYPVESIPYQSHGVDWRISAISEILALPEKEGINVSDVV